MTTTEPAPGHADPERDEWCGHDELHEDCPRCEVENDEFAELHANPLRMGPDRGPSLFFLLISGFATFFVVFAPDTTLRWIAGVLAAGFAVWSWREL